MPARGTFTDVGDVANWTPAAGFVSGIRSASVAPAPSRTAPARVAPTRPAQDAIPARRPSGSRADDGQSAKFQVMIVLLPTVAIPMPIRRAFGLRMFAMWFQCPGYGSAMNWAWHQSRVACWLIPMW